MITIFQVDYTRLPDIWSKIGYFYWHSASLWHCVRYRWTFVLNVYKIVYWLYINFAPHFTLFYLVHVMAYDWANQLNNGMMINILLTYLIWIGFALALVLSSALFVHFVAPQAIGNNQIRMCTTAKITYSTHRISSILYIRELIKL